MDVTMTYARVSLPKPLINDIDDIVNRGYRGYRSRAEVITDAIRRFLDEIEKKEASK